MKMLNVYIPNPCDKFLLNSTLFNLTHISYYYTLIIFEDLNLGDISLLIDNIRSCN